METARIEKRLGVQATTDRLWDPVADLSQWSRWNPVELNPAGTIAFGSQITAIESFEGLPERQITARVVEWQPYSQLVWTEKRGLWFTATRYFEIEELDRGSCIIASGVIFGGLRGEMYFDKNRRRIGAGLQAVVDQWKAVAEAG